MRWVRDPTGRLPQRPFYEQGELDRECEAIIAAFLHDRYGSVTYPVKTDDLVRLLERETADLDLYADLDAGVEGVTDFFFLSGWEAARPHRPRAVGAIMAGKPLADDANP